jgi:pyruvate-formate lyase
MAKKKFNVTSTLAKNKKTTPQPELASKIPLRKSTKDLEEVKEKVESLHSDESSTNKSSKADKQPEPVAKTQPNSRTQSTKKKPQKPTEPEKLVRLTIDTPAEMHTRLKVKAVLSGVSMRDYILRLLERELKKG